MTSRRWFLPDTPDVLGLLRSQVAVTAEGLEAFRAWAAGDPAASRDVREAEHRGDVAKRELLIALRAAFVTPIEPEDVFALSRGIDRLLNYARELINESEAMACPPDARIAAMASLLADALRRIDTAIASLGADADAATEAADAAITGAAARACLLRGHGRPAPNRATATSASHAASSTGAALSSARPSSTSPSVSSTPS